jgi:hypothetical protein
MGGFEVPQPLHSNAPILVSYLLVSVNPVVKFQASRQFHPKKHHIIKQVVFLEAPSQARIFNFKQLE